jgi:hypothetical protein
MFPARMVSSVHYNSFHLRETHHEDIESDAVDGGYRARTGYGGECAGGLLRIRGLLCFLFRLREVKAR